MPVSWPMRMAMPMSRSKSNRAVLLTALSLVGAAVAPAAAQSPPPHADWFTFSTDHFRVIYHEGLEPLARHAAAVAERTHALLSEELVAPPRGRTELVVTDHADFSNGFAMPFTANRIVVFARPPLVTPSLAFSRDWLELVIAHELVHVFHLDRAGPVGRAVRGVFGRVPMLWPLFPAVGTPVWNVEGLATHYESRLTGAGRGHGSYHDMVIRTAALEAEIPPLRRVSAPSPVWPGGERSYIYGAAFMEWITAAHGPEALSALVDATYGSILPTFLFFDQVARGPLGRPFSALYEQWRSAAADSARAVRDRLAADGLTVAETVVGRGPFAVAPRVSGDGRFLSYAAHDYRTDPATRVVDLRTGDVTTLARRNQFAWMLGPASWLPGDTVMVVAQMEYRGSYRVYSDLWTLYRDGRERRLTRGQRLAQPDVAPDGRRVVAVQTEDGAIHLATHDLDTGETRVIVRAAPGDGFAAPRWSPDGARVAVTRYAGGQVDVVVVDPATGGILPLTDDAALDAAPAWSPDGRWVVFWSDRTGIPNLFAAPVHDVAPAVASAGPERRPLRQVTNLLGGAFDPEVSPDGRTVYFASYHYDGWHLERIPFDSATWRVAPPPAIDYRDGLLPPPAVAERPGGAARRYSGLAGARPYFWVPTFRSLYDDPADQRSRFLGVFSMGWDVLEQHRWTGDLAYDVDTGRLAGSGAWAWARLGTPVVTARAGRHWSRAGRIEVADELEAVFLREDWLSLDAVFWRRQWRSTGWFGVAADLQGDQYQAYQLGDDALADAGLQLRELPTTAGLAARGGFSNARQHPYSISRQDGITATAGVGRRWLVDTGGRAYDEVRGSIGAFRGYRLWGFADHVIAARVAGLLRVGDDVRTTSIGGTPGISPDILGLNVPTGSSFLPVRGFRSGDRFGTRAWTASAEYRFPLHLSGAAGPVLGFSLTSVSGAVFTDAGNAWCTEVERELRGIQACPGADAPILASVGAELNLTLGVLQGVPLSTRYGFALPVSGPRSGVVFHVGFGPSF